MDATGGGEHVNTVFVTARDDEGTVTSRTDTKRLPVEPGDPSLPGVPLQVSLSDNTVAPDGREFNYELAIFNFTGGPIADVDVAVTLPRGLRFGSLPGVVFPDGCDPADSSASSVVAARCSIEGGSWLWLIPVELEEGDAVAQTLVGTALVTWDGGEYRDQEPTGLAGAGVEVVDDFSSGAAQLAWLGLLTLLLLAIAGLAVSWIRRGRTATRSWELWHGF